MIAKRVSAINGMRFSVSANERSSRSSPRSTVAHHSSFRSSQATNCENLAPDTVNAIVKQLRELQSHPAEGISVSDLSLIHI